MNNAHLIAFGLFALFQIFSLGTFVENLIKKKQASLNFAPAFFMFCGFLWFGVLDGKFSLLIAVLYLLLLIVFDVAMSILNAYLTKDFPTT